MLGEILERLEGCGRGFGGVGEVGLEPMLSLGVHTVTVHWHMAANRCSLLCGQAAAAWPSAVHLPPDEFVLACMAQEQLFHLRDRATRMRPVGSVLC